MSFWRGRYLNMTDQEWLNLCARKEYTLISEAKLKELLTVEPRVASAEVRLRKLEQDVDNVEDLRSELAELQKRYDTNLAAWKAAGGKFVTADLEARVQAADSLAVAVERLGKTLVMGKPEDIRKFVLELGGAVAAYRKTVEAPWPAPSRSAWNAEERWDCIRNAWNKS
jgi:hypothetical protein